MEKIRLTASALKKIVSDIYEKIHHSHINNVTVINSFDLFITFSNNRKEKLLISLNPENPFLSLIEINDPCSTKLGAMNDFLRKEVKDGFVLSFDTINNDRVACLKYGCTNEFYDREERYIIIELIPHRPNLIVLSSDKKILFAKHYADLSAPHPIVKGMTYEELTNKNDNETKDFDFIGYKKMADSYYFMAKQRRLNEQFKPVLQHIKSRIKSLKQKINVLNKSIEEASNAEVFKEIGSNILAYSYSEEDLKQYIEENNISYDASLKPSANAEKYFKKYKKAKRTIEVGKVELNKTVDEIAYLEDCLAQTKYMNEEDIIELGNLLFPHKFKLPVKKKVEYKPSSIVMDNTTIYFGKNAKQNDFLTFKKANKTDTFVHIKDYHGSHVIIADSKPSKEVLLTACEIALLLSGKEVGEVQVTLVKNIKKGSQLGEAILQSYETYVINNIREETKLLLQK